MKILVIVICMMLSAVKAKDPPLMIAHASGGINGQNYSNSIEALDLNYAKGFRVFEIDFSWTSDRQLVCLHDWDKRFKKVFRFKTKHTLSYAEFKALLNNTNGLHPCTLNSLEMWLKQHPSVKIITDVKVDNIEAISKIIEQYPHLLNRFIPQFYQPEEYQHLKNMGFKQLIWILYQFEGKLSTVPNYVKHMNLLAISMRASQAKKKFAKELIANGENVLVYTINKQNKLKKLVKDYQVSGIYTDFLNINESESGHYKL